MFKIRNTIKIKKYFLKNNLPPLYYFSEDFGNDIELTEEEQIKLLEQYENEKKNQKSSPTQNKLPIGEKVIFKQETPKKELIPNKLQKHPYEERSKLNKNDSSVSLDTPSSNSSTDGDWEKINDIDK